MRASRAPRRAGTAQLRRATSHSRSGSRSEGPASPAARRSASPTAATSCCDGAANPRQVASGAGDAGQCIEAPAGFLNPPDQAFEVGCGGCGRSAVWSGVGRGERRARRWPAAGRRRRCGRCRSGGLACRSSGRRRWTGRIRSAARSPPWSCRRSLGARTARPRPAGSEIDVGRSLSCHSASPIRSLPGRECPSVVGRATIPLFGGGGTGRAGARREARATGPGRAGVAAPDAGRPPMRPEVGRVALEELRPAGPDDGVQLLPAGLAVAGHERGGAVVAVPRRRELLLSRFLGVAPLLQQELGPMAGMFGATRTHDLVASFRAGPAGADAVLHGVRSGRAGSSGRSRRSVSVTAGPADSSRRTAGASVQRGGVWRRWTGCGREVERALLRLGRAGAGARPSRRAAGGAGAGAAAVVRAVRTCAAGCCGCRGRGRPRWSPRRCGWGRRGSSGRHAAVLGPGAGRRWRRWPPERAVRSRARSTRAAAGHACGALSCRRRIGWRW
ncbi:MAG: hypothetical protein MZV63_56540 [Marinilabiliales bacterium]|nr:hypothetical protein [Marinilabiliales bacterium]